MEVKIKTVKNSAAENKTQTGEHRCSPPKNEIVDPIVIYQNIWAR